MRNRRNEDSFGNRAMFRLALPLIVSVACFAVTLFTDRTLLMWFDPQSGAASMAAGTLYWTIACIPVTAMSFTTPLVAAAAVRPRRLLGQTVPILGGIAPGSVYEHRMRRRSRMVSLVCQSGWITLSTLPLLIIIAAASPLLFRWVGHEPGLANEEAIYFQRLLLVAPASMLEAGLSAFFVGRRITGPILLINLITAAVNIGLDVWLIFGGLSVPAMGVAGAAWATVIAMWLKSTFMFAWLISTKSFRRVIQSTWKPQWKTMREIMGPGSTLGIQQLIRSFAMSFILVGIGAGSVIGLAASTAAISLYQFIAIPTIGLATAVTVMAGEATGAGGPLLAWAVTRRALFWGLAYISLFASVTFLQPNALLNLSFGTQHAAPQRQSEAPDRMDGGSATVVDESMADEPLRGTATTLLRLAAIYGFFDIALLIVAAGLKGMGRTLVLLLSTCCATALTLASSYIASFLGWQGVYIWWSILILWVILQLSGLLLAVWLRSKPFSSRWSLTNGVCGTT